MRPTMEQIDKYLAYGNDMSERDYDHDYVYTVKRLAGKIDILKNGRDKHITYIEMLTRKINELELLRMNLYNSRESFNNDVDILE